MTSKLLFIESMDILATIPQYHALIAGFALLWLLWFIAKRGNNSSDRSNVDDEENELERKLSDWSPESLVPKITKEHPSLRPRSLTSRVGKNITIDGKVCLNLATKSFLNLVENEELDVEAAKAIEKYGVGSCGPRGFYGTVDVHLRLEDRLAKFMGTEEAIVYSYGFSTIASAVPAYCKRRDIVYADERINFAIQKGLEASRAQVRYFAHNDPRDLERLLANRAEEEAKDPKRAAKIRRFLVVEGIYADTGRLCPLPELVAICERYKLRIFLDESVSFGAIGATGRGVTEHFGVPISKIDMIVGSLETSLSSIGGFCVGSSFVVEHQRLSGLGYCFSASLPPLLTSAAIKALDIVESQPEIFESLRKNCVAFDRGLRRIEAFETSGSDESPVKHLYLRETLDPAEETKILDEITLMCCDEGLAVVRAAYLEAERRMPRPSVRICVSAALCEHEIDFALKTLENCAKRVLI